MDVIDEWTGRYAAALQAALRLTQDEFAGQLGIARRTVANWHKKPDVLITKELQRVLDTTYERSNEATKIRFARHVKAADDATDTGAADVALSVAISVVMREDEILIVCRRELEPSGITWQFPAGIVKPGADPSVVAVRETLAETGIHCAIKERLGSRIHPRSGVKCDYFICDYLTGTVENRDSTENVDVIWVNRASLTRFIASDTIFPPILRALEVVQ